ncbi:MAG TPA: glycoside hydrolase family 140 protein, partial [Bacteroidales bacterium]|nr:glycoside hydrolase family 140 protein [Bacteroidales bacterium]
MKRLLILTVLTSSFLFTNAQSKYSISRLKVSPDKHYLVRQDGTPFFYLGDTAWELFHRLNREEATKYLEDRAKKGFTVIQAVAIAELDGHKDPNAYGFLPLENLDPSKPAIKDGPDNDYWDNVDFIVNKANELGLYIGFLPTWGRYWHDENPLFTPENAEVYGEWIGKRYGQKGVIWILGGDRKIENDTQRRIVEAMAKGLRKGDGGRNLISFHPRGASGSSEYFQDAEWLDFNMRQNGHQAEYAGTYTDKDPVPTGNTRIDYDRTPVKPVIDGEPLYEDHPLRFRAKDNGHSIAMDIRHCLYWDLFDGAFGHTYGHHSVWQMWSEKKNPINGPLMPWHEAINQPGAGQMQYGRKLIESRPFLTRIPDNSILVTDRVPTSVPGAGRYRFAATRDIDGTYAMIYVPAGRAFTVKMNVIKGQKISAWWYNPRNGKASATGTYSNTGEKTFMPPDPGEELDWVLVLDDASKKYQAPGSKSLF